MTQSSYIQFSSDLTNFSIFALDIIVNSRVWWYFGDRLSPFFCCSVTKSGLTLCDSVDCSTAGFPVLPLSPKLAQTHVHGVSDASQPSHLLSSLLLLPSVFPSNRIFPSESVLHIRWPKYWSFSISPSNEYSGLISFSDWLFWSPCSPRDSQESSTSQFKSINSSALSLLYGPTLTSIHDYWEKPKLWLDRPLLAK